MSSRWKTLLSSAFAGALLGAGVFGAADVAGDFTTFYILRNQALQLAQENDDLKKQIGYPYSLGPWWNARIGFSASRNIAQCSFQLQGQQQITDVTVRGIRRAGFANTFAYNVAGPGEWSLIDCSAMFPTGGGLVSPRSLIPEPQRPAGAGHGEVMQGAGAAAAATHAAMESPASEQQQPPAQPPRSRWWLWPAKSDKLQTPSS